MNQNLTTLPQKKGLPPTPYQQSQPTILSKLIGIINPTIIWHASWETLWTLWILQNFTETTAGLLCCVAVADLAEKLATSMPETHMPRTWRGWKLDEKCWKLSWKTFVENTSGFMSNNTTMVLHLVFIVLIFRTVTLPQRWNRQQECFLHKG